MWYASQVSYIAANITGWFPTENVQQEIWLRRRIFDIKKSSFIFFYNLDEARIVPLAEAVEANSLTEGSITQLFMRVGMIPPWAWYPPWYPPYEGDTPLSYPLSSVGYYELQSTILYSHKSHKKSHPEVLLQ